jgi:hypothetical protein
MEIISKDSFAISTIYHGIKTVLLSNCSTISNIIIKQLNHQTTAIDFSANSNMVAFANANIIYIYDLTNKHIIQTIRTNEGIITTLKFMPNTPYIITGTNYGRVMQYRYDGRAQLSRLCSFGHFSTLKKPIKNNYVSTFAFYEDYVASTGYGGIISVIRLNSRSFKININNSKVRINTLLFLDKHTIISGNAKGVLQIQKVDKYKSAKSIQTQYTTIKDICQIPNTPFILISGDSNNLSVVDTQKEKLISSKYITFNDEIEKIKITPDNDLLVFLKNKHLLISELPKAQHLKSFILNNKLDEAFNFIEKYPTLQGTREHKRVEVMYEKIYSDAIAALIKSNKKQALKIIEMFKNVNTKRDETNKIFDDFHQYHRFKTLYLEKKHSLAYAVADKYPSLKRTHEYKKMEEEFKNNFSFAQKQILIGREDVAKEILSPYANITSKRDILHLIFTFNDDFISFLKAIESKDFIVIEKLLKKHKTFKDIPSYAALKNSINEDLEIIKELLIKGDTESAKVHISKLENIDTIKHEIQHLLNILKYTKLLYKNYDQNRFVNCYELIDKHTELEDLELSILLDKHWEKLMLECEQYALLGDLKSIKSTLKELIKVKTRSQKIGDLIRVSFHTKLKALIAKRSLKNAENIIYSYIDIFGIDSEILYIMKIFEKVSNKKLAITINKKDSNKRDKWLESKFIIGEY